MRPSRKRIHAFTLIELLVVISIVAILMGLAFPVFQGVQNTAKKTQAKNDLVQIVTAVNAFYTEYGKYPLATQGSDRTLPGDEPQKDMMSTLRGISVGLNPRQVAFISPPDAKTANPPRGGIGPQGDEQFYDPWGKPYVVRIDGDYDNKVPNPYSPDTGAGGADIRQGVIAYSPGKDGRGGAGPKSSGDGKDDVISWQ